MNNPRPPRGIGYTVEQQAAMRAVEEEAVLDLIRTAVGRLNAIGDRLEAYAGTRKPERPEERT